MDVESVDRTGLRLLAFAFLLKIPASTAPRPDLDAAPPLGSPRTGDRCQCRHPHRRNVHIVRLLDRPYRRSISSEPSLPRPCPTPFRCYPPRQKSNSLLPTTY